MQPIDARDNTYIGSIKEVNGKDPKFKVCDHVRISKYKNIFAKGCTTNWPEEVFVIKYVKSAVPWLKGYVYDFSADYDAIAVDDILDIH